MPDSNIRKKKESLKKIGDYGIGEKIGRGAFGQVYKALNTKTGEFVAIKSIDVCKIDKNALVSVKSEFDILQKLRHNNIVKVLGVVETQSQMNFILEYVENGSLRDVLDRFGPLSEELCTVYLYQLLQGLAYLHQNKVIHRDIKCSNILITKEGVVKLADFGVASQISEETQLRFSVVGTPYWMSPEAIQISGCSSASDIWSLACSMIELLQLHPPYHNLQPMSAMFKIVQDEHPPYPENISKEFEDFLNQSFQKDPNKRPTASELLKHPIFKKIHPIPNYSELQSTLKTLNGRNRLRTSVSAIDWGTSANTANPPNSMPPLPSSIPSSSCNKSVITDDEYNKLQTTIKQQANTIASLSEELNSLKNKVKEKPKLDEQQFYREYFMQLSINVKINQFNLGKTCEPVDLQQLYERAREDDIKWYQLMEWIPKQLIGDSSLSASSSSSSLSSSSSSLSSSNGAIKESLALASSTNTNKTKKKFGFFS
ncbi:hypothetical protein DICPUDRAFT_95528 [Dictyostelium purpureum]|uniref:non-specific serine/threonine protein kinase n=1 Tax=Dictyostelium purpureum TaxID=5786 RepID=F0ZXE0_DICPU|nr:uncharacterized protein DICPUDRAFT_95528 [Dictyostelium purpureum]EGC31385.1 hypothetical protein DICPUDRAFT_95528 [Dictyostelium purpureum]|eukprot:XP_003292083.1 hypothetical protein DICPUDRAFT_95528 [Dictyostelium purpureum]